MNKNLAIIVVVAVGAIVASTIMYQVMRMQDAMEGSSYQPTVTQIARSCAYQIRETGAVADPTAVTACVRTVLKGVE